MKRAWLIVLFAFVAALAGTVAGRAIMDQRSHTESELHQLLHQELDLDAGQLARIESMEAAFAVRRRALEAELREDNARLAAAITAERGYGPRVTAEVDRSHQVMGQLQKETLAHIFAMRAVLRPDQATEFDRAVVRALTDDAR